MSESRQQSPDEGSTDMQVGSHRERNKQRAQRRRERETSAERAQRREIERRRAAARRHNETPEEREIRRLNGRMRAMRRRENETEDERLRRRELNRIRMAERRRCLKTAPGADDPPDYADIQSSDLTSADVRRESDPRALGFRVSANSGNSSAPPPPPPTEDAMSRAFSSLNMSQSDMAMLFHPGRLMNISQPTSCNTNSDTLDHMSDLCLAKSIHVNRLLILSSS
ncbi:hypothetical protein GGI19_006089 [Coemansia pectinata]|uniref:Uncharacterized protein n=1 Tax=Coemansia pectinata TaxID=1052879 RepID=A0A9W8GVC3_9FUNG|nr:hypothetical protein GGI19_006089 [Coemansia pectinata]